MTDDSKVVDLAQARKAKQVDARPCSPTEPADRGAQRGKYMAFLCSHLVDQLDRMKEEDFDWRAAARAALEANLLGRGTDAVLTDINQAVSLLTRWRLALLQAQQVVRTNPPPWNDASSPDGGNWRERWATTGQSQSSTSRT